MAQDSSPGARSTDSFHSMIMTRGLCLEPSPPIRKSCMMAISHQDKAEPFLRISAMIHLDCYCILYPSFKPPFGSDPRVFRIP